MISGLTTCPHLTLSKEFSLPKRQRLLPVITTNQTVENKRLCGAQSHRNTCNMACTKRTWESLWKRRQKSCQSEKQGSVL